MTANACKWVEPQPVTPPPDVFALVGGDRLLADALVRRGLNTAETAQAFLDPTRYYIPAPPEELPDMDKAVERIEAAIRSGERIGVWGDFDVDGQTATALLVSALQSLSANVVYYVPVRARESHGVAIESLKSFLEKGVQLVITCDTGVSAADAVLYAQQRGVEFIVTDHHTLPPQLPPALAVVNPQRLEPNHPLSFLCGVGCAFKLVEALYQRAGRCAELEQFYDLVAIGTIADMAELRGDNRYLVRRGLEQLRKCERLGISALLERAEIDPANLSEEHIGFAIAPRLNALGRLGDANPGVELLMTSELDQARQIADQLEELNNQRRLLCGQVFGAALAQIHKNPALLNTSALVLNHPDWHPGVIGIVASRLAELYHRPVVMLASPAGGVARASARSIAGINITAAIAANQQLLLGFGGHPMAAGFSLPSERIPDLRRALDQTIHALTEGHSPVSMLCIDVYIALESVTLELVESLDRLAPYGLGNPPVIFAAGNLKLNSVNSIGKNSEHLHLVVEDSIGVSKEVLWWQGAGAPLPEGRFDLAFQARANDYRGKRQVQIEWVAWRIAEAAALTSPTHALEILDLRRETDPLAASSFIPTTGCAVWAQGEPVHGFSTFERCQLAPAETLAVLTVPPGRAEFQAALDLVKPKRVILFGFTSASDDLSDFLTRLAGLARYALRAHNGVVALAQLASATCQRESTIQKGIEWLAANGHIAFEVSQHGLLHLQAGGKTDPERRARVESELAALLHETAAYREYYLRADTSLLT